MENSIIEIFKFIGGLAGLFTFLWKLLEQKKRYLTIKLEISNENDLVTALTTIENKDYLKKKIANAVLIIGPEDETMVNIMAQFNCDNIVKFADNEREADIINRRYAYIPLPYYFDGVDNIQIGDETLTFKKSIDPVEFDPGIYSVKFYLFEDNRYPRSTQDLMIIPDN